MRPQELEDARQALHHLSEATDRELTHRRTQEDPERRRQVQELGRMARSMLRRLHALEGPPPACDPRNDCGAQAGFRLWTCSYTGRGPCPWCGLDRTRRGA